MKLRNHPLLRFCIIFYHRIILVFGRRVFAEIRVASFRKSGPQLTSPPADAPPEMKSKQ